MVARVDDLPISDSRGGLHIYMSGSNGRIGQWKKVLHKREAALMLEKEGIWTVEDSSDAVSRYRYERLCNRFFKWLLEMASRNA